MTDNSRKRYEDDEPDLKSISNCIDGKIEITPEICKKFWEYRADSGHLHHLLFDLLGEDFVTTHRQDESIRKVLKDWDTHRPTPAPESLFSETTLDRVKREAAAEAREEVLEILRQEITKRSWVDTDGDLHEGALTWYEIEESLRTGGGK